MHYQASIIAKVLAAKWKAAGDPIIEHLLLDSRLMNFPGSSVFFAIEGQQNDGHNYLQAAFDEGVRCFVVNEGKNIPDTILPFCINVNNSLEALQKLARYHRQQFQLPMVAITGSNGKTVIKEYLASFLSGQYNLVRSPLSYNSQVGVPLSIWQIKAQHNLGIFEAGISLPNEMLALREMIAPSFGILSHLGPAHDSGFESFEAKVREKIQLFEHCDWLVYVENPLVEELLTEMDYFGKRFRISDQNRGARLFYEPVEGDKESYRIKINQQFWQFKSDSLVDAENVAFSVAAMHLLGLPARKIQAAIEDIPSIPMRLEQKAGISNCQIINDSYNSDLLSLEAALQFQENQHNHLKRSLILSDILENADPQLNEKVDRLLVNSSLHRLFIVGEEMKNSGFFEDLAETETLFFASTEDLLLRIDDIDFQSESILIKGARKFRFERVADRLAARQHQTVFRVNLSSIVHNLNVYRSKLKPEVKIMGMVKAFSYGAGSYQIAKLLQHHKVDYLAVAFPDEGIQLRKEGITLPIMVLNVPLHQMSQLEKYELEPEIANFDQLHAFINQYRSSSNIPGIHLKLETGMNRMGFDEKEIPELLNLLQQRKLDVKSIFSHLAASDEAIHDDFSREQINQFKKYSGQIATICASNPFFHILNSAGILRFPDAHFDLVRIGIGLYGIDSSGHLDRQLQEAGRLTTYISGLRQVDEGETVGYGRRAIMQKDTLVATVSIGYADGLFRSAGQGRLKMWLRGNLVSILGSVCMDTCMLDVSAVSNVKVGDEVVVFGSEISVAQQAKVLETISYELLAAIGSRVPRVYVKD